jgi:ribose transport system substrate-binding protein
MKKSRRNLVLLLAGFLALFSACKKEGTAADGGKGGEITIAFIAAEVGIPYFTTMEWGARDAAKKYNVDLNFTGPAEWDINKQMPYIDAALATKPAGIIIVPTDPNSLVTYVETWMKDGIGVISVDVPLEEHVDLVGYESNQYSGGVAAADFMFAATKGEGSYLPVSTVPGSFGANSRCQGFIDRMRELKPDVQILDIVYPHHDARKAAELASAAIMGVPDLAGIFVATSGPASGVSSAVIEAGQGGKIKICSFDADPQQVEDLKAGVYDCLIAQDPYQMGYDAVANLVLYARGEKTEADFENAVENYPMKALSRDNVDDPSSVQFRYIATLDSVLQK